MACATASGDGNWFLLSRPEADSAVQNNNTASTLASPIQRCWAAPSAR